MLSLKFKRLLILSHSEKSGNQFTFKDGLNLITADDNSVGKSTLVKLLYWGLGCDPTFDSIWNKLKCRTIVEFSIDKDSYQVYRSDSVINFKRIGGTIDIFKKVSGAYSEMIASLVNFHVLLPNQSTKKLEVPPPAYYFLPFYIDQKKGWGSPWEGFENLKQYSEWKGNVIKYHVGLLSPEYFEYERLIGENKSLQRGCEVEVNKLDNALEIVQPYINSIAATISEDEFEELNQEIQIDLKKLADEQESILDNLAKAETDKASITHQGLLIKAAVAELDKDYAFAVENIPQGIFECPLCATKHNNSVINRAFILKDKESATAQLGDIDLRIAANDVKVYRLQTKLQAVRDQINSINDKYMREEGSQSINLTEIVNTIAAKTISKEASIAKGIKLADIKELRGKAKDLTKGRKATIDVEQIASVDKHFIDTLTLFINILDAEAVDVTLIKSPTKYNAIFKEGGAAENARTVLAYYLAVFSTISLYGSEVVAPIVVDTPNQQEQSLDNYIRIVNLLTNDLFQKSQVIICALDRDAISPIKNKAYVIKLDENKLLSPKYYGQLVRVFSEMGDVADA